MIDHVERDGDRNAVQRIRRLSKIAWFFTAFGLLILIWTFGEPLIALALGSNEFQEILREAHGFLARMDEYAPVREALGEPMLIRERYDWFTVMFTLAFSSDTEVIGIYALIWAGNLFRGYGRGDIFSEQAATRLWHIGLAILVIAPIGAVTEMFALKAIVLNQKPWTALFDFGSLDISLLGVVGIEEVDAIAVVIGILILVVARILGEAAKISEENQAFV